MKKFISKKILPICSSFILTLTTLITPWMPAYGATIDSRGSSGDGSYEDLMDKEGYLNVKHYEIPDGYAFGDTMTTRDIFTVPSYSGHVLQRHRNTESDEQVGYYERYEESENGSLYFNEVYGHDNKAPFQNAIKVWGYLIPDKTGTYAINVYSDDGAYGEIYVEGSKEIFIDDWQLKSAGYGEPIKSYALTKGEIYPIYVEYFENKATEAVFYLRLREKKGNGDWKGDWENIPKTWLYPSVYEVEEFIENLESPTIHITAPEGQITAQPFQIIGTTVPSCEVKITIIKDNEIIKETRTQSDKEGNWHWEVEDCEDGYLMIQAEVTKRGLTATDTMSIEKDTQAPKIIITEPEEPLTLNIESDSLRVKGTVEDTSETSVIVTIGQVQKEATLESTQWEVVFDSEDIEQLPEGELAIIAEATDAYGHETEVVRPDRLFKDTIAPHGPVITIKADSVVNDPLEVMLAPHPEDTHLLRMEYKVDDGQWQTYEGVLFINQESIIYARAIDQAFNRSEITQRRLDTIGLRVDILSPANDSMINLATTSVQIQGQVDPISPNNQVKVRIEGVEQTAVVEDNGLWHTHFPINLLVDLGDTLTVTVDATDGIYTSTDTIQLKKDLIAPLPPVIEATPIELTNGNVAILLMPNPEETEIVQLKYRLGEAKIWHLYEETMAPIIISENTTISAIAVDVAGNHSKISQQVIDNILREKPLPPQVIYPEMGRLIKDKSIEMIGLASEGEKIQLSISDGINTYTTEVEVVEGQWQVPMSIASLEDGTITIEATSIDALGNRSEVSTVTFVKDTVGLEPPVIQVSEEAITNQPVTVTLKDNSGLGSLMKYKLSGGEWLPYTGPFQVWENTVVYGVIYDEAGNGSRAKRAINNIDRLPPRAPSITTPEEELVTNRKTLTVSGTGEVESRITVTLMDPTEFSETREVRVDEWGDWTLDFELGGYEDGDLGIIARSIDEAGNSSEDVYRAFIKDTLAPEAPVIITTPEVTTSTSVIVNLEDPNPSDTEILYRKGDGPWRKYRKPFEVTQKTTVSALTIDLAGNQSEVVEKIIDNIDNEAPAEPKILSPEDPSITNQVAITVEGEAEAGVMVEVQVTDEAGHSQKAIRTVDEGGRWSVELYLAPLAEGNLIVRARTLDELDNASTWDEIILIKDTLAPEAPAIKATPMEATSADVVVTIEGDGEGDLYYRILEGQWLPYVEALRIVNNTTVSAIAIDRAGNASEVTTKSINNIDKEAPSMPRVLTPEAGSYLTTDTLTVTGSGEVGTVVKVTVMDSNEQLIEGEAVVDGEGSWQLTLETGSLQEGTVLLFAEGIDGVGNVSEAMMVTFVKDVTAPLAPSISHTPTTTTTGKVTVTITDPNEPLEISQYKKGIAGEWTLYVAPFTITDNTTIYAKTIDLAGHESAVIEHEINNIKASSSGSGSSKSSSSQTITVADEEDVDLSLYGKADIRKISQGDAFEIILTLKNLSDETARDIVIGGSLPEGITLNHVSGNVKKKLEGEEMLLTVTQLAKGKTLEIVLNYRVDKVETSPKTVVMNYNIQEKENYQNLEDDSTKVGIVLYDPSYVGTHQSYIVGFPDGEFKGERTITRAEIAAIFRRILNLPKDSTTTAFDQELEGHWAKEDIKSVVAAGLFSGYEDGTFRPDASITRSELATVIAVMLKIHQPTLKTQATYYKDLENHWASGNIEAIYYYGIIDEFDQENFKPNDNLTRAETVVMINQLFFRGPLMTDKEIFSDLTGDEWYYHHVLEASLNHRYQIVDQYEVEVE